MVERLLVEVAPPLALFVMAFFFILAATNVFWHRMIMRWQVSNLRIHRESYYLIGAIFLLALVFLVVIFRASGSTSSGVSITASTG